MLVLFLASSLVLLGGCETPAPTGPEPATPERSLDELGAEGPEVFGPDPAADETLAPPPSDSPFAQPVRRPEGWTIVLASVPGGVRSFGEQQAELIRTRGKLPDAFLAERGGKLFVALGGYADPSSPEAKKTLERVQKTEVNGTRPYAFAFFAPPSGAGARGSNPAFNLDRAKAAFGPDALYTLQVGIYGRADGQTPTPEELDLFRETAERAVRELRAEGELAFYHHGRTRSTVTVGVFGPDDHDPSVRPAIESARLEQTRERHPFNLLNGQGIRERVRGSDGAARESMQKSFLVAIPG